MLHTRAKHIRIKDAYAGRSAISVVVTAVAIEVAELAVSFPVFWTNFARIRKTGGVGRSRGDVLA